MKKVKYPVKYALLPIKERRTNKDGEEYFINICHIVSKVFVTKEFRVYLEDGNYDVNYSVCFPYEVNSDGIIEEMRIPSFNSSDYNETIAFDLYDNYEEAQKAKVPSPTISSLTDKNGTRYKIVSVRAKDEGIIVTLQLSNNDDQYMIKLKDVSIVDSRNNRTKSSQIKANGKYSSNFVLNMSETTTVEIFFYGIKGKPSYLQLLQIQEDDSHSTLQFKNLEIK